ncbi:SH3 domain-containing protein [Coleofasciculus sp. H7-2]|uniref:SH3 domain-containing protein n=1 Tax=Coleofasciculus sp. H7-2 TaxID=3351545 RepID=UPI0036724FD2
MSNSRNSLTAIALLCFYTTSLQLIAQTNANAATPTLQAQSRLAQNTNICSFINGNNVNIRKIPSTKSQAIAKLNRGDIVRAVRRQGNWVQISGRVTSQPGVTPEVVKPLKGWVLNTYINGCSEDQFDRWRK